MIFVDSNIPMYLVGSDHPNKTRCRDLLEDLIGREERLVTSVEVYQEILRRFTAIRRVEAIDPAIEILSSLVDEALEFGMREIRKTRSIIDSVDGISARDALHTAVMQTAGVSQILSFDKGFDRCPGIERLC